MTASPAAAPVTVYSTSWCGYCHRLTGQLDRAGIEYDLVDIERQADGAAVVARVNNGNLTVPTVVFPDGSARTNPSLREVQATLAGLS